MPVLSLVMPFQGQRDIDFALALATKIALRELRAGGIPKIYKSGVKWKRDVCRAPEVPGACERFLSPRQTLKEHPRGLGSDCDDIVPWRAAEIIYEVEKALQARGMPKAKARRKAWKAATAYAVPSPGVGWHILLKRADGETEDPSKRLGMGKTKRARVKRPPWRR